MESSRLFNSVMNGTIDFGDAIKTEGKFLTVTAGMNSIPSV
jgi:hypothetical protein